MVLHHEAQSTTHVIPEKCSGIIRGLFPKTKRRAVAASVRRRAYGTELSCEHEALGRVCQGEQARLPPPRAKGLERAGRRRPAPHRFRAKTVGVRNATECARATRVDRWRRSRLPGTRTLPADAVMAVGS